MSKEVREMMDRITGTRRCFRCHHRKPNCLPVAVGLLSGYKTIRWLCRKCDEKIDQLEGINDGRG